MIWRRRLAFPILSGLIAGLGLAAFCYAEAQRDPVVRRATIALPGLPSGTRPITVALLSDIHIGTVAMTAARLDRIVTQVNALKPDLVLIAGDFIYGHVPQSAARVGAPMAAPLSRLDSPLGTVAVFGNHDHWTGLPAVAEQLRTAGITALENDAVTRGRLAIGGIGDDFSHHDDIAGTLHKLATLPGAPLLLTHSPDIMPELPAGSVLLAGHTHCGQVVLPWFGPISEVSRFGPRYRCGLVRDEGGTVIVTAGLGTSAVPFRLNAPPDLWLITLVPVTGHPR